MFGRKKMLEMAKDIQTLETALNELKVELKNQRLIEGCDIPDYTFLPHIPGLALGELRVDVDALMDCCKLEKVCVAAQEEKIVLRKRTVWHKFVDFLQSYRNSKDVARIRFS